VATIETSITFTFVSHEAMHTISAKLYMLCHCLTSDWKFVTFSRAINVHLSEGWARKTLWPR